MIGGCMTTDSTEAILGLLGRYGELQDAADFEGVAELFAHGAFIVDGLYETRGARPSWPASASTTTSTRTGPCAPSTW